MYNRMSPLGIGTYPDMRAKVAQMHFQGHFVMQLSAFPMGASVRLNPRFVLARILLCREVMHAAAPGGSIRKGTDIGPAGWRRSREYAGEEAVKHNVTAARRNLALSKPEQGA